MCVGFTAGLRSNLWDKAEGTWWTDEEQTQEDGSISMDVSVPFLISWWFGFILFFCFLRRCWDTFVPNLPSHMYVLDSRHVPSPVLATRECT